MYQIGLFSKINFITTKTLRHYDEISLLKPDHVDYLTGYRYYTNEQLPRLHRILALKQLGLSLNEIKEIIENPLSIEVFLKLKERELQEEIERETRRLTEVRTWINHVKGEITMSYTPILKELPRVIVASMRTTIPSYDTYFDVVPKMGEEMGRQGAVIEENPAYCFTIYHDGEYKERDIDVEVCEAVQKACDDSEMVKYKTIEKVGTAACVLHKGPYKTIRDAYGFLFTWIKENNYEIDGNPRESYIDGIWNKENENDWLTELQVPVKKK
ncbi:MAG: MerR family transcriptional regulator [Spirochaetaceae bacterium]|nr:MerR family transcriptional regulator [Spirochaetaceae bacterium]